MKSNISFPSQGSELLRASFFYIPAFLLMIAVYVQPYVKISTLTRDAVIVAKGEFYYGLISNLGILLWCAAATACLFSFILMRMWKMNNHSTFLLCGGLLTTVLLFDDFFMLHEEVVPKYLGIREEYIAVTYPTLIAGFLLYFHNSLLHTSYLVLLSALCFLGLSVISDMLAPKYISEIETFLEDGFKLLGIVGWCYYFTSTCLAILKRSAKEKFYHRERIEQTLETIY